MWREDDYSCANRCCDWVYVGDIESYDCHVCTITWVSAPVNQEFI